MHENVYTSENSKSTRCVDTSWGAIIRGTHYKVLTEKFNTREIAWLLLPTYNATDNFEGATLATERTP